MTENPAVLLLVTNVERREAVRRRLIEMEVLPIAVRADRAREAVSRYRPIAALIDEWHASVAADDFLECACTNHMRLVSLPDADAAGVFSDDALWSAATPRPA
jgi:hypothetical protein